MSSLTKTENNVSYATTNPTGAAVSTKKKSPGTSSAPSMSPHFQASHQEQPKIPAATDQHHPRNTPEEGHTQGDGEPMCPKKKSVEHQRPSSETPSLSSTVSTVSSQATSTTRQSHNTAAAESKKGEPIDLPLYKNFDDMPLHASLLRGIYSFGFEKPSIIQQQAIVPFIQGPDIIAQAPSGTGKTGAFTIGMLQRIDFRRVQQCQALVLSPTRELAAQNQEAIAQIGSYMSNGIECCQLFVGGNRVSEDIKRLSSKNTATTVAVGTPGRVADLIRRGALRTGGMQVLVLDEADELMSQGFCPQLMEIMKFLPRDIQVALFSATMSPEVLELCDRFMRDPTRILVNKEQLSLDGIKQFYIALEEEDKMIALKDLYESVSISQSVIFVNSRRKAEWVVHELSKDHHTVACIHGEMPASERWQVMKGFRSGSSRVLVATDVISRGIDVQHVNIVINYDVPTNLECYLHRIGRSGRYGRKGLAMNFTSRREAPLLRQIAEHYAIHIPELPAAFQQYLEDD